MVKDGEDWHALQATTLKSLAKLFKPCNRHAAPLRFSLSEVSGFTIIRNIGQDGGRACACRP